jgi:uncharacterized membrane protein YhaH (DUF805 family)
MSVPTLARDSATCPQCGEPFDDDGSSFDDVSDIDPFAESESDLEAAAEELPPSSLEDLVSDLEIPLTPESPPSSSSPVLPVSGWYEDPTGMVDVHRYWDGSGWTDQTRAVPGSVNVPFEAVPPRGWDWKWLLFSFEGRAHRAHYWGGGFAVGVIFVAFVLLFGLLSGGSDVGFGFGIIIGGIALFYMSLTITVKRWHDRDKSGLWYLIGFVPYIGSFWVLIECGMLEGTRGPNTYGPDPRGQGQVGF